jgi:hypothetical protein
VLSGGGWGVSGTKIGCWNQVCRACCQVHFLDFVPCQVMWWGVSDLESMRAMMARASEGSERLSLWRRAGSWAMSGSVLPAGG